MNPGLKAVTDGLTRVADLQIDAQPCLEFLQRYKALRSLTVCLLKTSRIDMADTLPLLPDLQHLRVHFDETFAGLANSAANHYRDLINLSLLKGLQKLEFHGPVMSSMWSLTVAGQSTSIEQFTVEDVQWIGRGWDTFYPRIASRLRSLTLINVTMHSVSPTILPLLETLDIDDVPEEGFPEFICPQLSLVVCTVRRSTATISHLLEHFLFRFTQSLETFVLRQTKDDRVETLSPPAVRTFTHCKRLRNFLLEGRICITAQDWWVLRKVHSEVDRAIFLQPVHPGSKDEKIFCVRFSSRLADRDTKEIRKLSETLLLQTMTF